MKISKYKLTTLFSATIAFAMIASLGHAANPSDQDKKFLTSYEKIHTALAADDLTLQEARSAFEKLSGRAKTMIAGQSGYYVAHCPMLNKDWVQTSTTISNPYGGKDMVSCGEIKK